MTGQDDGHRPDRLPIDLAAQRRRLATLAAVIAGTEDRIADTLERLALTRPQDAARLRARAAQARQYATLERSQAVAFSHPLWLSEPAPDPHGRQPPRAESRQAAEPIFGSKKGP